MGVRSSFCAFLISSLFFSCSDTAEDFALPENAPNFIIIITDDQRFDALGIAQQNSERVSRFPWLTLPTIDSLASSGTYFQNAFVTTSLCSPSRASILTGQYARRHGITDNNSHFNLPSFASELERYGYFTGYFGKWHMGNQSGKRPGFDHSYSFVGQGEYFDTDFELNGKQMSSEGWVDEISTEHLIYNLHKLPSQTQPFCFMLGMKSSHGPWNRAPEATKNHFVGESLVEVPSFESLPESVLHSDMAGVIDSETRRQYIVYFQYLAAVDQQVKKIVNMLEDTGLSENTYLVFMSDNGFFMGEHQIKIDKRLAYEESMRIPLIINGPTVNAQVNESIVLNVDLCPTILELAGVPNLLDVQGKSMVPLLRQQMTDWREEFVYEYYKEPYGIQSDIFAIRTDQFKLVRYQQHPEWDEFFNIKSDPYETSNEISNGQYSSQIESMDRKLDMSFR